VKFSSPSIGAVNTKSPKAIFSRQKIPRLFSAILLARRRHVVVYFVDCGATAATGCFLLAKMALIKARRDVHARPTANSKRQQVLSADIYQQLVDIEF
jgi:hypothetical protein